LRQGFFPYYIFFHNTHVLDGNFAHHCLYVHIFQNSLKKLKFIPDF
jgi:hypothetical protein